MNNTFKDCKDKGQKWEDICFPYFKSMAENEGFTLRSVKDMLGENTYRFNDLKWPDYTITDKSNKTVKMFLECKRKNGWVFDNNLQVGVEKKFIDDYLELSIHFHVPLIIYMYCDTDNNAYIIDDFTDLKNRIFAFDNYYTKNDSESTYVWKINELQLCSDLSGSIN